MKNVLLGLLALFSLNSFAESSFSKCSKDGQIIQLLDQDEANTVISGRIDGIYLGVTAAKTTNEDSEYYMSKVARTTVILKIENENGKGVLQIINQDGIIEKNLICN